MNKLVEIKLHNELGKYVGETWKLAVSSVREALHAINILSKQKFKHFLYENEKKGLKYEILINKRKFTDKLDPKNPETIANCELVMNLGNLQTIDIVPVFEGADENIGAIVGGVLLIIAGIVVSGLSFGLAAPLGTALIIGGISLIAAGVINLLSPQPEFQDFREFTGGKSSYLFNGPQNVTREGGPVPVGYGRLIVGSQVIAASYEISEQNADENIISQ